MQSCFNCHFSILSFAAPILALFVSATNDPISLIIRLDLEPSPSSTTYNTLLRPSPRVVHVHDVLLTFMLVLCRAHSTITFRYSCDEMNPPLSKDNTSSSMSTSFGDIFLIIRRGELRLCVDSDILVPVYLQPARAHHAATAAVRTACPSRRTPDPDDQSVQSKLLCVPARCIADDHALSGSHTRCTTRARCGAHRYARATTRSLRSSANSY